MIRQTKIYTGDFTPTGWESGIQIQSAQKLLKAEENKIADIEYGVNSKGTAAYLTLIFETVEDRMAFRNTGGASTDGNTAKAGAIAKPEGTKYDDDGAVTIAEYIETL
tara:strand:+ start:625 stop:948 length:324 start_codon:yes stop_codon:yes gene_type:complete